MGEIDIRLKDFIKIDSVFAQLFNQGVFGGEDLIDSDKLEEQDSVIQETIQLSENDLKSLERLRDVQKVATVFDNPVNFRIILSVENQLGVNYYMPVRCMEGDALTYSCQCKKIAQKAKENEKLKKYADGVPKGTKILPTISLVFYCGAKAWDGPLSVYDMLDISEDVKERMKPIIPDYPMKLIDAKHMSDKEIEQFSGDLKAFLLMIRKRYNPKALKSVVAKHRETWYTVSAIKKDKRYIDYINTVSDDELEGGLCMDATLDYIEAKGRRKGKAEERTEGIKIFIVDNIEEGIPEERTIAKLQRHYHLTQAEAEQYINTVSEDELEKGVCMDATLDYIEAKGMAKVNQLVLFLSRDGRVEDIVKSAEDREYQKQLFIEYGLENSEKK